jgi:hypothetical protein
MRGNAQVGDTVVYDEREWTVEARYHIRGRGMVDIRDAEGWHMSEVPAWNVRIQGDGGHDDWRSASTGAMS